MKYTPSALVSQFSGKQGSTVASHNRFGPYFRNRTIPTNPNTLVQQQARNNLTAGSKAWKNLTATQRSAWANAATLITLYDRLGRAYKPTGFQFYMSCARTIYVYDPTAALPANPPASAQPVSLTSVILTITAGTPAFGVAFAVSPVAAATKILIEASPQLSAGVNYIGRSQLRQIIVSVAAATSPQTALAGYNARFGTLVAGKRIGVRCTVITSDGQRSAPLLVLGTVAA